MHADAAGGQPANTTCRCKQTWRNCRLLVSVAARIRQPGRRENLTLNRSDPGMARSVYVPAPPAPSVTVCAGQTSTGGRTTANVHAKSRLTPEPLRTLRSETKVQAGACPDRTRAIPCKVRTVIAEASMIRNMLGMVPAARAMSGQVRAGLQCKFDRPGGRTREPCAQVRILLGAPIMTRPNPV
jgi:hypothetical protein